MQRSVVDYCGAFFGIEVVTLVGDMDPFFMGLDRHVND